MTSSAIIAHDSVQAQNDRLRREGDSGPIVVTSGVQALGADAVSSILAAVARFDDFSPDNDPFGEHDFGAVEVLGQAIFFKIDPYDRDLRYGSPDPADPRVTCRVMTIMLAEEY